MKEIIPLLSIQNIYKSFASNPVLSGVNIRLNRGEVVAVIGGNGAGKSTLMKILMGIYKADSGTIFINGSEVSLMNPSHSLDLGIYLVPQEPMLFPNMTVEENIIIGMNQSKAELKRELKIIIKKMGWEVSLIRKADTLSIAEQQLVEILRGLLRKARILIFDEPTSALTFREVNLLFQIIEDLKHQGIGIFYITHRLKEVFEIATEVYVLKDGIITSSGKIDNFTEELLIKGLISDEDDKVSELSTEKGEHPVFVNDKEITEDVRIEKILEINRFTGYGFRDINLTVNTGQILGLAGVVGSGRTELAEAIFGLNRTISGEVLLYGEDITGLRTSEIIKRGINYLPEDRHLNGIFGESSVKINLNASTLFIDSKFIINGKKESEISSQYIQKFSIKVMDEDQKISSLSGGNQQKVVIGKVLSTSPQLIILDEPTRGIDAGARSDVYRIIEQLKNDGRAILLISSDFEEILILSDRIEVMHGGTNVRSFTREEISMDQLTEAAFGLVG